MVSPELLRRYAFFAGLSYENIVTLAGLAEEETVEAGHVFFHEGERLDRFYLLVQGNVGVIIELPDTRVEQPVSGQLTGVLKTRDVVVSTVGPGEVFGWSALVPPHTATAGAKALTPCRVVVFDAAGLLKAFAEDCHFGYVMMQKAAETIRSRLHDMHIQSLAAVVE
ncbi:MAG: cyclic nucleotide-binding domain-containing protein [Caldilineales bacterium]|nr:cyclic nucleotide-binding domain-containing protein [Caldilineales bacterium]